MMGIFPERVDPQFGATQGYQSKHFLRDGFKLETLWAPPAMLAVRMPGSGLALKQRLAEVPYSAIWDAIGSCNRSLGRVVRAARQPRSEARVAPAPATTRRSSRARSTRWRSIFFAAGARTVLPGVHGLPDELRSPRRGGDPAHAPDPPAAIW